jgi:UDP-2,3-diacylglucosamine pyrophosphatase LpxH
MTNTIYRRPKKKVKFQHVHEIIASEHTITKEEKRVSWYIQEEYDKFKFDAAHDACVRLFNSCAHAHKNSGIQELRATTTNAHTHKFVTAGNFDDKYGEDALSLITNAATCNAPRRCTNEYNDTIINDGDEICKRGLGYHFSRFRKRNKARTRTLVLAWHKKMSLIILENSRKRDKMPVNLSQQDDSKLNENCQRFLAMVSSKCSRYACQSALWRARMDYEVAYPENCESFFRVNSNGSVSTMDLHRKLKRVGNSCAWTERTCDP